jgi:hypothetical protein
MCYGGSGKRVLSLFLTAGMLAFFHRATGYFYGMKNFKMERLAKGESFVTKEKGHSMVPLIKSNQEHRLAPATWEDVSVGDVVYCKVSGRHFTHLVKAKNADKGCQIGNNKGHINGWTKQVYGKVVEVL